MNTFRTWLLPRLQGNLQRVKAALGFGRATVVAPAAARSANDSGLLSLFGPGPGLASSEAAPRQPAARPVVAPSPEVAALTELLNQQPKVRRTLKQLSAVEQTLNLTRGLDSVPPSVLEPAVKQLEALAAPFGDDRLRVLHELMQRRVDDQHHRQAVIDRWVERQALPDVTESFEAFPLIGLFDDDNPGRAESGPPDFADTMPMMYPDEIEALTAMRAAS